MPITSLPIEQMDRGELKAEYVRRFGPLPKNYLYTEVDLRRSLKEDMNIEGTKVQVEGRTAPKSNLPPGVSLKGPWGDLGKTRQKEMKILAPVFVRKGRKIQFPK